MNNKEINAAPLLRITGLIKHYGERCLFEIPQLELRHAAAYVLTGANGAGKSTLLRIIAGLVPAHAESLQFQGTAGKLNPFPAFMRSSVIYVHQHPIMFCTTVEKNIAYGLRCRGVSSPDIAQRVRLAMEWARLDHVRETPPLQLSGGEKQKVALARARVLKPDLLLLDEPTANLDGPAREQILALIPTLIRSGMTIVVACHDRDIVRMDGVTRLRIKDRRLLNG